MISSVLISFIVFLLDVLILQKHALIFISQYTDVLLTIWQVQASVSTLTLSATAFIIGRISITYYGVSIKDLLYLPNGKKMLGLSFWESIIAALLLLFVTGIFVFLNDFFSVATIASIAIYLTIQITLECISVISESRKYAEQARILVEGLVKLVLKEESNSESSRMLNSNNTDSKMIASTKETAQEHFSLILRNFDIEIENKIRSNIHLLFDPSFEFFFYNIISDLTKSNEDKYSNRLLESMNSLLRG